MNSSTKFMYPLFESICLGESGVAHFERHLQRMQKSSRALWGREVHFPDLLNTLLTYQTSAIQKCKVMYNAEFFIVDCQNYQPRHIEFLQLVLDDEIEYAHKWTDRQALTKHLVDLPVQGDVLIVKRGLLSDTSYSNIALWNGREWHTPAKPLLRGIRREVLIGEGKLIVKDIRIQDLKQYQSISLINAMLDIGEVELCIDAIKSPSDPIL